MNEFISEVKIYGRVQVLYNIFYEIGCRGFS